MKNKSNDPAAVILRSAIQHLGRQSQLGTNLLKLKEFLVPGRGVESGRKSK